MSVVEPVSLLEKSFNAIVKVTITSRIYALLDSENGILALEPDDEKKIKVLKNVAYKVSMFSLLIFGCFEWVGRTVLSLSFYSLYLLLKSITWMVKKSVEIVQNSEKEKQPFPSSCFSLKIANKVYTLGLSLLASNKPLSCDILDATMDLFFVRNNL
jgi:hypothetical protein